MAADKRAPAAPPQTSTSWRTSSSLPTSDILVWERRSTQILMAIRRFLDGLRSAPSLKERLPFTTKGEGPATSKKEIDSGSNNGGSLLMHLNSLGVMRHVQELQQEPAGQSPTTNTPKPNILRMEKTALGSLLQNQHEADERKQILYQIVFPLLENLEQCYEILDNLPQTHEDTPSKTQFQSKASNQKNSVPPPLGMLSLNDYTNVACLLEFAVSATLIPCLEYPHVYLPSLPPNNNKNTSTDMKLHIINNHTTFMARKRNQNIPKSLAGRISKIALIWGTKCAAENHDSLCKDLSAFSSHHFHTDQNSSSPKCPLSLCQIFHTYNIFQGYNEMTNLAIKIGRLLLLDRFRPMLLPRHLSDVYLTLLIEERLRWYLSKLNKHIPFEMDDDLLTALIKTEKIIEERNSQRLHSLRKALLVSPLNFPSSLISAAAVALPSSKNVDYLNAALAYRSLLGGGASMIITDASNPFMPPWLRLRLGQCLTKLAREDLQSVVEVFVAYACSPGSSNGNSRNDVNDVMTGAAVRLACALCTKPTSTPNSSYSKNNYCLFQEKVCSQFVKFMVTEGDILAEELRANEGIDLARPRSSMAMHLTLWATIAQLPIENLHSFFITKLTSGLIPLEGDDSRRPLSNQLTAMQSIASIAAWLFTVPSSLDQSTKKKVQSFLLSSMSLPLLECHQWTMLGQTLRLAASFSPENANTTESTLVVEIDKEGGHKVAVRLIEMTLAHMIRILVRIDTSDTNIGQDQSASVALEFLKAVSTNDLDKEGYRFERSESENGDHLGKMYIRSTDAVSSVNLSCLIRGVECRAKCLVGAIVSLSKMSSDTSDANEDSDFLIHLLPSTLFRLVLFLHYSNMSTIGGDCAEHANTPSKLECFGFEHLLKSYGDELKIAATVLLAVLCENCSPSSLLGSNQGNREADTGVLKMLGLVINSAAVYIEEAKTINAEDDHSAELFSSTSIVLSLLVAVLELGAEKRSDSDESFFQSILPSLRVLASECVEGGGLESIQIPELAEMASHAMALIVARDKIVNPYDVQKPAVTIESRLEAIVEKLSQAECDLLSSHPPLRAKGIVSLRHVARSLITRDSDLGLSPNEEERQMLIMEIGVPLKNLSAKEEIALISRTLARICLNALADPESYVYLASIQTLVAISDVCPFEILPLMSVVIVKGNHNIDVAMANSVATNVELSLTPEQRIKATEALIFMIRRRGEGIFAYGSSLLETMLFCPNRDQGKHEPNLRDEEHTHQLIQSQTHTYFMGDTNKELEESMHSRSDGKKIRLNTGGPVFSIEENDMLRAGAISVVCELVSVLDPIVVASYCHILVGLATGALQLEASRPVRRAAARLAHELYACVMREVTAEDGTTEECASTMAVAIVNANEEQLFTVLSRCVSADDLALKTKNRLVDPATQSRSAEAIKTRLELKAMGILQAAATIAYSLEHESKDPNVQAIQRALSRNAV